jgi:hypothetical protein
MPIYEKNRTACGHEFEMLVRREYELKHND